MICRIFEKSVIILVSVHRKDIGASIYALVDSLIQNVYIHLFVGWTVPIIYNMVGNLKVAYPQRTSLPSLFARAENKDEVIIINGISMLKIE